jgi:alpha-amylase/alpha-mannosidase (GH57 family)
MEKYICIHGHFYQPPRENPWLESVELQDSASPYHDWNERITAECYAPNATARMLDGEGRITRIVSTYSKISFNFGPTVLAWMKDKMSDVHDAIVAADKASQENFSGHGSAIAQVYNHMIMPLAHPRDKVTQVVWGIRDFEHRFGRKPEGMWLAETAVDAETLEVLAQHGICFTILSPYQASRTREIGKRAWRDVNGARIDPTRPYRYKLPSGKTIALFFYDAPVSQGVAFENLLDAGERFAERLTSAFNDRRTCDQLVHIATDGESYGHHHRYGEMALGYALHYLESKGLAKLTNYGEYLEKHQPTHEVQIHEKSAWSCSHGVGRWMENCGCNSGGHAGWHQNWRAPLRQALDWLRDEIAPEFERKAREYLKDPWAARNDYVAVILDRSDENIARFLDQHASRSLNDAEKVIVIKLLEMERQTMLMYTSCGWFFDEVSGLETVQVVQYAGRAIQIARDVLQKDFEEGFLERLQHIKSNIPENCDGRCIYEKFVRPAMVDWENVVAHYAISSVFHPYQREAKIFNFSFEELHAERFSAGRAKLAVGTCRVRFDVTRESQDRSYSVLYLGEHNITGAVNGFKDKEAFEAMRNELKEAFDRADFPEVIRAMSRHFGQSHYSLKSLFKDEQRRILDEILLSARDDLESRYRSIAERYTPLMKFLGDLRVPLPPGLQTASDYVLQVDIMREFESETPNVGRLRRRVDEAKARHLKVFNDDLSYRVKLCMESLLQKLRHEPGDPAFSQIVAGVAGIIRTLPLSPNFWRVQSIYWEMLQNTVPEFQTRAHNGDDQAHAWLQHFRELGEHLGFAPSLVEVPTAPAHAERPEAELAHA